MFIEKDFSCFSKQLFLGTAQVLTVKNVEPRGSLQGFTGSVYLNLLLIFDLWERQSKKCGCLERIEHELPKCIKSIQNEAK